MHIVDWSISVWVVHCVVSIKDTHFHFSQWKHDWSMGKHSRGNTSLKHVVTFMSSHIPRVDLSCQDKTFHAVLSAPPPLSFDLHWGAKVEKMGMLVTRWCIWVPTHTRTYSTTCVTHDATMFWQALHRRFANCIASYHNVLTGFIWLITKLADTSQYIVVTYQ